MKDTNNCPTCDYPKALCQCSGAEEQEQNDMQNEKESNHEDKKATTQVTGNLVALDSVELQLNSTTLVIEVLAQRKANQIHQSPELKPVLKESTIDDAKLQTSPEQENEAGNNNNEESASVTAFSMSPSF